MPTWRVAAYRAVRPLLLALDPETVHQAVLRALSGASASPTGRALCRLASGAPPPPADAATELVGLRFRNRIGLGAGFDKDGEAIGAWAALGFGFVELGTVTPRPQPGNPRPRLVRLPPDEALINRMGFNNAGAAALARRIETARGHLPEGFVIGVNIGRNRDTAEERAIDDYAAAARLVAGVADYLAINVSSPNTPGVRSLQAPERLRALLAGVARAAPRLPLFVKLAPDLEREARDRLIEALEDEGAAGVIASNTTVSRAGLRSPRATEPGGLSGRPLAARTAEIVHEIRAAAGDRLVVIASGGLDRRPASADLVQLWTAMIYRGPGTIGEAVRAG